MRRYRSVVADSERWEGFEFRADDIVISTPAKCGTTWMQMICALLIFQSPELPARLTELSPWLDMQLYPLDEVRAALASQAHRRFMKTHTPFDGIPFDDRVTYIFVARDPRDAAISMDNHRDNTNFDVMLSAREAVVGLDDLAELLPDGMPVRPDDAAERFWEWVESEEPVDRAVSSLKTLLHHADTFWAVRDRPNVILFHYDDLQADLEGEMRRLAKMLCIEVDAKRWPALVGAARFEHMRDHAAALAPVSNIAGFWNDTDRFFHRGTSGQWRELIGEDGEERYERRVGQLSGPEFAAWVHHGWRRAASAHGAPAD